MVKNKYRIDIVTPVVAKSVTKREVTENRQKQ